MRYTTDSILQVRLQSEHDPPLGQRASMTNHAGHGRSIRKKLDIQNTSRHVSDQ